MFFQFFDKSKIKFIFLVYYSRVKRIIKFYVALIYSVGNFSVQLSLFQKNKEP